MELLAEIDLHWPHQDEIFRQQNPQSLRQKSVSSVIHFVLTSHLDIKLFLPVIDLVLEYIPSSIALSFAQYTPLCS